MRGAAPEAVTFEKGVCFRLERLERLARRLLRAAQAQEQPMGLVEAAAFLATTPAALSKRAQAGQVPCHRPGGRKLYFYRSELNEWVRTKATSMSSPH